MTDPMLDKWIEEVAIDGGYLIFTADLRAFMAGKRIVNAEPVRYLVSPDNHELPVPLPPPPTKETRHD